MSSNWLFEKRADGTIRMHTFSFDFHTKERHASLLSMLGVPHPVRSTLDEVATHA